MRGLANTGSSTLSSEQDIAENPENAFTSPSVLCKLTHRFVVDPEGHPRDDDNNEAREVDGLQEERDLPPELELYSQATVSS